MGWRAAGDAQVVVAIVGGLKRVTGFALAVIAVLVLVDVVTAVADVSRFFALATDIICRAQVSLTDAARMLGCRRGSGRRSGFGCWRGTGCSGGVWTGQRCGCSSRGGGRSKGDSVIDAASAIAPRRPKPTKPAGATARCALRRAADCGILTTRNCEGED